MIISIIILGLICFLKFNTELKLLIFLEALLLSCLIYIENPDILTLNILVLGACETGVGLSLIIHWSRC